MAIRTTQPPVSPAPTDPSALPTSPNAPPAHRWGRPLLVGAGLGLLAALAMLLVFGVLRLALGIPTPPESIPDRIAPLLGIQLFFGLFGVFEGYNGLKQFGVLSITAGMLIVGVLLGIGYIRWQRQERDSVMRQRVGPQTKLAVALAALWLLSLVGLLPVLQTNFRGFSPRPATALFALGWLLAYATFGLALALAYRLTMPRAAHAADGAASSQFDRRTVLTTASGVALAFGVGAVMRSLNDRAVFDYDGTQYRPTGAGNAILSAPTTGEPAPTLVPPPLAIITPTDRFYSVTKNVVDPTPDVNVWRLEVGDAVADEKVYTFDQLRALPVSEQATTLMCISNGVDGGLMSNAVWQGVPLRDVLNISRIQPGSVKVVLTGADGYTDTIPFAKAMEPTTLLVYMMNGEPIPQKHGYPVRVIVPGMYGEKQVKWVTRLDVVQVDVKGFYETQGWGPNFSIQPRARMDAPDFHFPLTAGTQVTVRGIAFGGDKGVSRVEFSADDGKTWTDAKIDNPGTPISWAIWNARWTPATPGVYQLAVRATDGVGMVQTPEFHDIAPQGARGYHRITAKVQ